MEMETMEPAHPKRRPRASARHISVVFAVGRLWRRSGAALVFLLGIFVPPAFGAEPCILRLDPDAGPANGGTRVRVRLADRLRSGDVEVRFGELPARILGRAGDLLEVEAPAHHTRQRPTDKR